MLHPIQLYLNTHPFECSIYTASPKSPLRIGEKPHCAADPPLDRLPSPLPLSVSVSLSLSLSLPPSDQVIAFQTRI